MTYEEALQAAQEAANSDGHIYEVWCNGLEFAAHRYVGQEHYGSSWTCVIVHPDGAPGGPGFLHGRMPSEFLTEPARRPSWLSGEQRFKRRLLEVLDSFELRLRKLEER